MTDRWKQTLTSAARTVAFAMASVAIPALIEILAKPDHSWHPWLLAMVPAINAGLRVLYAMIKFHPEQKITAQLMGEK